MKLKELFKQLSYGELASLSISGEGSGTIITSGHPKMIQCINDALKDLFSRFVLLERQTLIKSLEWKSLYYLRKEFAFMDTTPGLKYILDTPQNKFTDDLVKILSVTNEVGDTLPMNDAEQWASVFTPHYDSVQLTHVGYDQVFGVSYQALHPTILFEVDGYLDQEISIPPIFEIPLRTKVALTIFGAMSGQEYSTKAQQLEMAYEARLAEIEQKNPIADLGMASNVKLLLRGFP